MTADQAVVFATLAGALALFVVGRWRYDVVALLALLTVTVGGALPASQAFAGFGHPAVITVAAVLIVSRSLHNSGLVDAITRQMTKIGGSPTIQVFSLAGLASLFSSFMNNVGALALLMPVAIRMARKTGTSPSLLLMPLAFASLLGGLTTLIGTPPNIIIATFRGQDGRDPFRMFDFAPVGISVALAGIAFISLIGWRMIPQRKGRASRHDLFSVDDYMTEVRVRKGSRLIGQRLGNLGTATDAEAVIVGLVRRKERRPNPSKRTIFRANDVLIVRADAENLKILIDAFGLELVGNEKITAEDLSSDEVSVIEAVASRGAFVEGRTARDLNLRRRYSVNLLAVAREGARLSGRLDGIRFRAGDVLLLQVPTGSVGDTLPALGCLPLVERGLLLGAPRRIALSTAILAAALASAATGLLTVQIAFAGAAVAMVIAGSISLRDAYDSVDWSVIVLLGAMLPVGQALETTGGAQLIADNVLKISSDVPPEVALALLLIVTMFLSDLVNNAAAAVVMAPIAVNLAAELNASPDPFLMAVAVGASSAFLTPIGHQSNTLVMGPGGYRFGDYWRMGLPLEVVIALVAIPLILLVWPP